MSALIKKGTSSSDQITISDKDNLSYQYQLYGLEGNDNLTGGKKSDVLVGGSGNDTLNGGLGNDILIGGLGQDVFLFSNTLEGMSNLDTLQDFDPANDKIRLDMSVFSMLPSGILNTTQFRTGSAAADVDDYLIHDSTTGVISYDSDGNGSGSSIPFVRVAPHTALSNASFFVTLPDSATAILNKVGSFSSYQDTFTTRSNDLFPHNNGLPFATQAMDQIFTALFGNALTISKMNANVQGSNSNVSITVSGALSNNQRLSFILEKSILDETIALDYTLTNPLDLGKLTSLEFLSGMGISSAEFVITTEGAKVNNPDLGPIDVDPGFNLIGTIDLANSSNQAFRFISQFMHINTLVGTVNIAPEDGASVTGEVDTDITLIKIGSFSLTETHMDLNAAMGFDFVPSVGISNTLEITGYDPTQSHEPTLSLTGGIAFDPKSVTLSSNTDAASTWKNPFGFFGAKINNLGLQVGATYIPPWLDNLGLLANIAWGDFDVNFAASLSITDPEKIAFTFGLNKPINAVELLTQLNLMALGPAATVLVNYAKPLFQYIPITISPIVSNSDGELDPLVSFVPFPASIGAYDLPEGFGIAGQMNLSGIKGTLSLQADTGFTELEGSLSISQFKLGNWISISGSQPGTDLTASIEISLTKGYGHITGDGSISLFGQTLAHAHFEYSPIDVTISNSSFGLGNLLVFNINTLNASLVNLSAHGNASISLLSHSIAGVDFSMNPEKVDFSAYIDLGDLTINGSFAWHTTVQNLNITGSGNIVLFGQTLAQTSYTLDPTHVYIGNTRFGLGNVLAFNVNSLTADLSSHSGSGSAGITLLGYQAAGVNFNINSQQVSFATAMDLGYLDITGSFVWNNPAQSLTIAGSASINNVNLANSILTYQGDTLSVAGNLDVNITGLGTVKTGVSTTLKNGVLSNIAVSASLAAGNFNLSISPADFNVSGIANSLSNKALTDIGPLSSWAQDSVNNGLASAFNPVTAAVSYTAQQVNNTIKNIGNTISSWFNKSQETDKTYVDETGISAKWIGNGGKDKAFGNGGNDTLEAHQGSDLLDGGAGNDSISAGSDNDQVDGGDGDDYLRGEEGFDTLYGGFGNDTLMGGSSTDSNYTGDDDLLYGGAGDDWLYGNSGIDRLYGNGGNDVLYANPANTNTDAYSDSLWGGTGNDTYYIGSNDVVSENADEGNDTVLINVSYILPANVENLTLLGSIAINGTGNSANNRIQGNDAANWLDGLDGNDFLDGGLGADTLVAGGGVDTLTGGAGNDFFRLINIWPVKTIINDFSVPDDTLLLPLAAFTKFTTTGVIKADNFSSTGSPNDSNDYLIYNKQTGDLSYDPDGNGTAQAQVIGTLSPNLALTNADFVIV